MSWTAQDLGTLSKYMNDAGGTYTDPKYGKVLGGWKAVDMVGRTGNLDQANSAWDSYQGLEKAYRAGGDLNLFKKAVAQLIHDHMHHPPDILGSIASAVGDVGGAISKVAHIVNQIPGFAAIINAAALAIPGVNVLAAAYDAYEAVSLVGNAVSSASSVVKAGADAIQATVGSDGLKGFQAAAGALTQQGVGTVQMAALKGLLPNDQAKAGFDAAVALNAGSSKSAPKPPIHFPPAKQAGWAIAHGAVATNMPHVVTTVTAHPEVLQGTVAAATQLNVKHASWWHRLLVKLHLTKDVAPNVTALKSSPAVASATK